MLQSETESEDDAENEKMSIHDEDSDWVEKESDEINLVSLTEEKLLYGNLPRTPTEGDHVVVRFDTKRKAVYYVGKILHNRNENLGYYVSYLRGNRKHQFNMPNVPDLAFVKEHDIKFILPNPKMGGSTLRQQSYYYFDIDFSERVCEVRVLYTQN